MFWKKKPDFSQFHAIGLKCWVLDQFPNTKFDPRSRKFTYLGPAENSAGWLYWDGRAVQTSRNIVFDDKQALSSAHQGEIAQIEGARHESSESDEPVINEVERVDRNGNVDPGSIAESVDAPEPAPQQEPESDVESPHSLDAD